MLRPLYTRNDRQKAAYLRAIAERACAANIGIWTACPWYADMAFITDYYDAPMISFSLSLTKDEQVLFVLLLADMLEAGDA